VAQVETYPRAVLGEIALEKVFDATLLPVRLLVASPPTLYLLALTAMLLRHPDIKFYELDRVVFCLLVLGTLGRAVILGHSCWVTQRATWPMLALAALATASVASQPFDCETWSLLAAKFVVPYSLFHLAQLAFCDAASRRKLEIFLLVILAYLSFTSIAFLVGAKSLIWPQYILDESLGYHADRARGPFLQAVANGVSLNLLELLAYHAWRRGVLRGWKAVLLLGSVPLAVVATMTRAVWLTFAGTVALLLWRSSRRRMRNAALALALVVAGGLALLALPNLRETLMDRLEERGPVDFRKAVYEGSWDMFLERPWTGWGVNQMPEQLARHVSGYREAVLYPHNTYLELLGEHGVLGLALYGWLMWELVRLGRGAGSERGFVDKGLVRLWPLLLGVYWVNAAVVVMNYQFVNGLIFTLAGMLAARPRQHQEARS